VLGQNLLSGHPIGNHRHHRGDREPQITNAGHACHLVGICRYAFECHSSIVLDPADADPTDPAGSTPWIENRPAWQVTGVFAEVAFVAEADLIVNEKASAREQDLVDVQVLKEESGME
jgi:hypothetical protein